MGKEQIKVLHIDTEKTWRGGQQQAAYLLEGMLNKGFETYMLCPPGSAMEDYCLRNKLPCFPLNFAHELDYGCGKDTAKIAFNLGANILQLHSGHSVSCGLWAKLFYHKIKLVATRRVDFSIRKNPLSRLKYSTSLLDRIVCISDKVRQVLIKDGVPENKLFVIHSGIDIHRFEGITTGSEIREKWKIPENAILVGTVAAFTGHKDYPNLLKAAAQVCRINSDVYFMALGDGELKDEIFKLTNSLKLNSKFVFTGFQEKIGNFLKAFDVFVLSSKKEGLGTSVLDAMSAGLPVVCTDAGGLPEMVNHMQSGIIVPAENSDALAKAIIKLADNGVMRLSLGQTAQEKVKNFDIGKTIDQYINLYTELVNERL